VFLSNKQAKQTKLGVYGDNLKASGDQIWHASHLHPCGKLFTFQTTIKLGYGEQIF